ncbi:ATP-binding protein [Clostridium tyrobutyricum]|uniref:AAA family ATPase n=1 Tax=Clostridium tyrobutyricum TaxID=1519 RepID=UPI001C380C79|nr:AAA family ATPase [Clostridium tyrobutyricum]MBV4420177.1 ATP-binding protein [Clostridium tyrobutyricum]
MYIKNFGHKVDNKQFIEDKEFNFSDRFKIKFDLKSRKLNIEKIKDGHPNFYGKYIENVKMLVGENGTGKSTLLDVLGMNRNDRIDESFVRKYKSLGTNIKSNVFHNSNDDISYFKDEYIIIYLIKDNEELEKCIFGMEVTGNFFKDKEWFIKNIVINKDTFYKLPIGFIFKYENNKIISMVYHFFDHIDKSGNIYRSPNDTYQYYHKICDLCHLFYFSHSYRERIRYGESKISDDVEKEDEEYLMKRFYRNFKFENASDWHSAYMFLYNKEYDEFRKAVFKANIEIDLLHSFKEEEVIPPPNSTSREQLIASNYDALKESMVDSLRFKSVGKKEDMILNWLNDYIMYNFTLLLKNSFSEDDIRNALSKNDINGKYIEENLRKYHINPGMFNNFNKELLMKTSDINEKIKSICDEFFYVTSVIEKVKHLQIHIIQTIFNISPDEKISDFELEAYHMIIISRYIFSRLSIAFDIIKEGKYQESFEKVIEKIMQLNEKCFQNNNEINLMYSLEKDEKIEKLLEVLEKYQYEQYSDIRVLFEFKLQNLSDGERVLFVLFSKIINLLRHGREDTLNIFLLDEPDCFLHPQWAKELMSNLFKAVGILDEKFRLNSQFIISTHSPFLLSDVRKQDVILLKSDSDVFGTTSNNIDTFGANIHTMMSNSFFLENTMGDFAGRKIKKVIENLTQKTKEELSNTPETKKDIEYTISLIGEPVIKRKLEQLFKDKFPKDRIDYEVKIKELEQQKRQLQKIVNSYKIQDILKLLNEKIKELKEKAGGINDKD